MNEIAESTSHTSLSTIQSATGFAEIGDRAELAVDGARGVPAGVECVAGFLGAVFVLETRIDITDEMIIIIITNDHLLNLPKLAHLAPKVLIKGIKVIL